jgi:hypothetical protein
MEALCALKRLTDSGELPKLRRGVRLLLVPEMTGTVLWLNQYPETAKHIRAAINLDMVGARQEPGTGPLVLTSLPRALPSFTEYAAMAALEAACCQYEGFNPVQKLPAVSYARSVFSGGSDHYILSDPTIGIPCTMLGQWPDKFYHTSGDAMARLSPEVLAASSGACAAFCAALCSLTLEGFKTLLRRGKARFAEELAAHAALSVAARDHLLAAYQAAARDGQRFLGDAAAEVAEAACAELAALAAAFPAENAPEAATTDSRVPVRQFVMPMDSLPQAARIAGQLGAWGAYDQGPRKAMPEAHMAEALAAYYMDGVRTVDAIVSLAELDVGAPLPGLPGYIELLKSIGAVRFA